MKNLFTAIIAILAIAGIMMLGLRAYDIESNYNETHPTTMYGSNSN